MQHHPKTVGKHFYPPNCCATLHQDGGTQPGTRSLIKLVIPCPLVIFTDSTAFRTRSVRNPGLGSTPNITISLQGITMAEHVPWWLWNITCLSWDIARARRQGLAGLLSRQRRRLAEQVAYARAHSRYYSELYRKLPDRIETPEILPVSTKFQLMQHFDDWVTDPDVTLEELRAFVDDQATIHQRFHGRYVVFQSSGSTGERGIYLVDRRDRAVHAALVLRSFLLSLSGREYLRLLAAGVRAAGIGAGAAHHASSAVAPPARLNGVLQMFSAETPLPDLVKQLNRFRPTILFGYASTIALLAGEQQAGRLRINPVLVSPGSEGLPPAVYDTISAVFGASVRSVYSAGELPRAAGGCRYQWLHVNCDWAVIEPVDADYRPTPAGQPSHTVLISNLVNRVQPFLRYDLGDSVLMRPDPCPCGSPLPAIRVQGRAAETLNLCNARGELVRLSSMAIGIAAGRAAQVQLYQIEQTAPTGLRVRFKPIPGAPDDDVWTNLRTSIAGLLSEHHLDNVDIQRASEPPQQSVSGKYSRIIPLDDVGRAAKTT